MNLAFVLLDFKQSPLESLFIEKCRGWGSGGGGGVVCCRREQGFSVVVICGAEGGDLKLSSLCSFSNSFAAILLWSVAAAAKCLLKRSLHGAGR